MPVPEATLVDKDTYERMPPPPPPRGTRDYRRCLLLILAACDSHAYQDRAHGFILHTGWRGAVDLMIEMMHLVGANAPDRCVDAYGGIHLDGEFAVLDEEASMAEAMRKAPDLYPELPLHEAVRRTLQAGEIVWGLPPKLQKVWEEAATALRRDGYTDGHTPARVALTKWLNDNYRDARVTMAAAAASVTYSVWRKVLPNGDLWVDDVLDDTPDLTGSVAWARSAQPVDVERQAPGVIEGMLKTGEEEARRRRRKGGGKRCKCCGQKKRS